MISKKLALVAAWAIVSCAASFAEDAARTVSPLPSTVVEPSSKRINFRINPEGLVYSVFGGAIDVKVIDHLSIGPDFYSFKGDSLRNDLHVFQYGFNILGYFWGDCFEDAWYVKTGLNSQFLSFNHDRSNQTFSGDYRSVTFNFGFGRNWHIWKGLNAMGGVGFSSYGSANILLKAPDDTIESRDAPLSMRIRPFLDLQVGWAF